MDTTELAINQTPQEITAALSLADGTDYFLSNTGSTAVYIAERAAAPGTGDARHRIPPGSEFYFAPSSARGIYVWALANSQVTVSEA